MSKKAQSQIITTVLIILLVLAAIVIVWQVVNTTVRSGAEQVETQSACLGINLIIVNANTTDVIVRRDPGAPDQTNVDALIYVNGQAADTNEVSDLDELESGIVTLTTVITAGDEVQVAPKLSSGTLCGLSPKRNAVSGPI